MEPELECRSGGEGYYYGGYLSNASVPGWAGPPLATSGMIRYGMDDRSWANFSGPDDIGRAEGVMTFIPASDSGMLVYFGGVQDPYHNGTLLPQPLSQIFIYDVVSTKWHVQIATGTIPESRRKFCAGAVWAKDRSSYNMYFPSTSPSPSPSLSFFSFRHSEQCQHMLRAAILTQGNASTDQDGTMSTYLAFRHSLGLRSIRSTGTELASSLPTRSAATS